MNAALDAVVCLLLVSAAVVGLVTVEQSPTPNLGQADAVADALATTTAQVNYSLAPGARAIDDTDPRYGDTAATPLDSPELDRTAHGSLAGLLARAATGTAGVSLDSADTDPQAVPLTQTRADFRRAVQEAVRARTGATARIDAVWRPYPDAPVGGAVGVGPRPPTDGVHTATLVVPTGIEPISASESTDFETLARAVADRSVQVLVPPGPAHVTLRGDDPAAGLVRYRYARLEAETNTSLSAPLATEDTAAANARVADALAPQVTADLRSRYDTPTAAAESVSVSSVRIVVRTWSPSAEAR